MPAYKRDSAYNYQRKQRRIAKYGKYKKLMGRKTTARVGGRIASVYKPVYRNPFRLDHEYVQLIYRETVAINPTALSLTSATNNWTFSFNSLFDPNFSGTGNQPMYFDNYANLYGRYKVSFAKMKATVVNHTVNTATANSSGVTTLQPNYSYRMAILRDVEDADIPTNINALLEQNAVNCKWRYIAPQLNGRLPQLSMNCAPHKTAGVSYDDDTISAATNGSPSRNIKGQIWICSADNITDPPTVYVDVQMTYYVKFFDRKNAQVTN